MNLTAIFCCLLRLRTWPNFEVSLAVSTHQRCEATVRLCRSGAHLSTLIRFVSIDSVPSRTRTYTVPNSRLENGLMELIFSWTLRVHWCTGLQPLAGGGAEAAICDKPLWKHGRRWVYRVLKGKMLRVCPASDLLYTSCSSFWIISSLHKEVWGLVPVIIHKSCT